ncbi:MAG TPA: type II secretion system protein GspI [Gammaproteobacteria bacterium]|nr:type II secretion system protein GspI [Gammaproteobacteria bacterium]
MMRGQRGFTLLEVLVALVVVALSLGAIVQATGSYTSNQAYLRDRTFAEWVAHNRLVMELLSSDWPDTGRTKGEVELPKAGADIGAREWRWVMQVSTTPEKELRRLDIEVYPLDADEDEAPLASLTGFKGKP